MAVGAWGNVPSCAVEAAMARACARVHPGQRSSGAGCGPVGRLRITLGLAALPPIRSHP